MSLPSLARALPALAVTFFLFHCTSQPERTAVYAASEQDTEVSRATGRFASADGKVVVEVCEAGRASPAVNDCQDSYVIQSGGRGERISDGSAGGVGCGGCPFDGVILPLRATVTRDATPSTYDGIADWGSDDGTSLRRDNVDYDLVAANGNTVPVSLRLRLDGTLELLESTNGQSSVTATLTRTGAATCPRP